MEAISLAVDVLEVSDDIFLAVICTLAEGSHLDQMEVSSNV